MEKIDVNLEIPKNENEGKKTISSVEVAGINLEIEKYYFEYPKNIQEETGILGYDRTIVSKESLTDFIKKDYQNRFGENIEKFGFTNMSSLLDGSSKRQEQQEAEKKFRDNLPRYPASDEEKEKYKNRPEWLEYINRIKKEISVLSETDNEICLTLVRGLSNGEYPNKCFTHEMNHYTDEEKKVENNKNFVNNRFFIQKIYDIDYIKKQKEDYKLFEHGIFNDTPGGDSKSDVSIFNKKTMEYISTVPIGGLARPEYFDGIKKGEFFACTIESGFNTEVGRFFNPLRTKFTSNNASFGFPIKGETFLNKYLYKALEIYLKKLLYKHWKEIERISFEDIGGIEAIFQELILSDENVFNMAYESKDPNLFYSSKEGGQKEVFIEILNKAFSKIEKEFNIKIDEYTSNFLEHMPDFIEYSRKSGDHPSSNRFELRLPVFIGLEEEIPQLSWGHAKYAHFMSSKGFNFIEFKHADHLPVKKEKK